jgi:hypothetical protein
MKRFRRKPVLTIVIFLCWINFAWGESYEEWVSTCKDYRDVSKWLSRNMNYDYQRYDEIWVQLRRYLSQEIDMEGLIVVRGPEETFKRRSGTCHDSSVFAKHSLNRINPNYKAEIVFLAVVGKYAHYQCGFWMDEKLFIMDYAAGLKEKSNRVEGTHGPFRDLGEYRSAFGKMHPTVHRLDKCQFGWPEITNPANRKW